MYEIIKISDLYCVFHNHRIISAYRTEDEAKRRITEIIQRERSFTHEQKKNR